MEICAIFLYKYYAIRIDCTKQYEEIILGSVKL